MPPSTEVAGQTISTSDIKPPTCPQPVSETENFVAFLFVIAIGAGLLKLISFIFEILFRADAWKFVEKQPLIALVLSAIIILSPLVASIRLNLLPGMRYMRAYEIYAYEKSIYDAKIKVITDREKREISLRHNQEYEIRVAAQQRAEAQQQQIIAQERAQADRAARMSYLENWVVNNFAVYEIKNDPHGRRDQREVAAEFRAFMATIDIKDWDVLHASGNPTVKLIMGAQRALPTPDIG